MLTATVQADSVNIASLHCYAVMFSILKCSLPCICI